MVKGFKNFLLRGDVVVLAIGFVVALAFSTLIKAFTADIITPIVTRVQGKHPVGLGIQLGASGNGSTFIIYYVIVQPYKAISARRGVTVFGDPAPVKTCPACLSDDLPLAAAKCKYCGSDQPAAAGA